MPSTAVLTFAGFADILLRVAQVSLPLRQSLALEGIGKMVAEEARNRVGVDPGSAPGPIGPFPGWAPLAPSTVERKGFENLLFETGEFQQDISYHVEPWKVTIGTHTEYIVYTELGTLKMPPRPVFGPSLLSKMPEILPLIGEAFLRAFVDASVMRPGVRRGYVAAGVLTGIGRWGASGDTYAGELQRVSENEAVVR